MKFKKTKKINEPWMKYYGDRKRYLKYPDLSMYDFFEKKALEFKDYTAYNYFNTKVTFNEFVKMIDKCARSFKALGVNKGDAVTVCSANIPEALISIYALNKIGAIANIIHPLSSQNEIKYFLNLAGSKVFVALDLVWSTVKNIIDDTKVEKTIILNVSTSFPKMTRLAYEMVKTKNIERPKKSDSIIYWVDFIHKGDAIKEDVNVHLKGKDYAAILYSGGTTGKPKGILIDNKAFNAVAMQARAFITSIKPGDSILGILPIFHGFGIAVSFHTMFCAGISNVMLPKFDADKFARLLARTRPDIILGVPTLFEAMVKDPKINNMDLSFIKFCVCGGDAVSVGLREKVDEMLFNNGSEAKICPGYGLTEALSGLGFNPPERPKGETIGIPLPDNYYKIVKPGTNIELPLGSVGEIVATGPTLMCGYLNEEEETNQALQIHPDGHLWLHTGDIGYFDEDGYLCFKQRLKRMIISSGYNIYPSHIEEVIEQIPEVLMVTVVGIDHKYKVQVPKAFVVLKEGIKPKAELKKKIMAHCEKNLAKYSLPYDIEFRESLPKTKLGKVAYTELK